MKMRYAYLALGPSISIQPLKNWLHEQTNKQILLRISSINQITDNRLIINRSKVSPLMENEEGKEQNRDTFAWKKEN